MIKLMSKHIAGTLGSAGLLLVLLGGMTAPAAAETPPQLRQQAPGYFRMAMGDFAITALYDGFVDLKPSLFSGASPEAMQAALAQSFMSATEGVQTAVNAYLVHTGKNLILVDAGTAKLFGPTLGFIPENLKAAGYDPAQVDTILLTHLHPDHTGGLLTPSGEVVFPNAQVFVSRADADFWLSEKVAAAAPKDFQGIFKMARDAVAPYQAAGRLTVFEPGATLRDGVKEVPAPGHTPGHTAYLFSSAGKDLLVWGDVVHNTAIQFQHPEVAFDFDSDKVQAVATRKGLLARSGTEGWWVAGAHIPFPGMGRIKAADEAAPAVSGGAAKPPAYRWVPVEYHPLPAKP